VITVTTLRGRKLGVMAPDAWFKTGRYVTLRFGCPLKAGKYRFSVKGIDGAENPTVKAARNYLIVSAARRVTARPALQFLELQPMVTAVPASSPAPVR
jgi:hypothetical protein